MRQGGYLLDDFAALGEGDAGVWLCVGRRRARVVEGRQSGGAGARSPHALNSGAGRGRAGAPTIRVVVAELLVLHRTQTCHS